MTDLKFSCSTILGRHCSTLTLVIEVDEACVEPHNGHVRYMKMQEGKQLTVSRANY